MERVGEFKIKINKGEEEARAVCDLCSGEASPLCARFCVPKAIKVVEE
jgi:Fe-S-cluster-containing hydrogenase component 2